MQDIWTLTLIAAQNKTHSLGPYILYTKIKNFNLLIYWRDRFTQLRSFQEQNCMDIGSFWFRKTPIPLD